MVIFLDMDVDDESLHDVNPYTYRRYQDANIPSRSTRADVMLETLGPSFSSNLVISAGAVTDPASQKLAEIVGSYPTIRSIIAHLDHTDLYNLSSVSRQIRLNLLANRQHLLPFTLECQAYRGDPLTSALLERKSSQKCVKDLVKPCIRCTVPTCRNCYTKVPRDVLKLRVCSMCLNAPIEKFINDGNIAPCSCPADRDVWICEKCARAASSAVYRYRRTDDEHDNFSRTEVQCAMGLHCVGAGWAPTSWIPVENDDQEYVYFEDYSIHKWTRWYCGICEGMILDKPSEYEALKRNREERAKSGIRSP